MLTKRRLVALAAAVACAAAWVTLISPGSPSGAGTPAGTTVRASLDDGVPGTPNTQSPGGGSNSSISGNGRFDVFVSRSKLGSGPGTQGCECSPAPYFSAVYVRDLVTNRTDQISIGLQLGDGQPDTVTTPNDDSDFPSISADGRYVSFVTRAQNITAPFDNAVAIVACDRGAPNASGAYKRTPVAGDPYPATFKCIQVTTYALTLQPESDGWPRLSSHAHRIVWAERQNSEPVTELGYSAVIRPGALAANPTAANDGFGPLQAPDAPPDQLNGDVLKFGQVETMQPFVSSDGPDGTWVVATATNVSGQFEDGIVEYHFDAGPGQATRRRVDLAPGAVPTNPAFLGNSDSGAGHPQVSADGSTVVYDVGNTGQQFSYPDVYATTVDTSAFTGQTPTPATSTTLVSGLADTTSVKGAPGDGGNPAISADGRYVAFVTDRDRMTGGPNEPTLSRQSCLVDPQIGFASRFTGAAPKGAVAAKRIAAAGPKAVLAPPSPSVTDSSGGPGPDRTLCQVVARDLVADAQRAAASLPLLPAELASPSVPCTPPPTTSSSPGGPSVPPPAPTCERHDSLRPVSLSANGGRVGYDSDASDLVANDTNTDSSNFFPGTDAFVRIWQPTVKATPVTFGDVKVGTSAGRTVTLTVQGFGPIDPGTITVTEPGTVPPDFTIVPGTNTCTGTTRHEGDPCSFEVVFAPTTEGTKTGTITVNNADPAGTTPIIKFDVTGKGTPGTPKNPLFSADPTAVNFGSNLPLDDTQHTVNGVVVQGKGVVVTITNTGGSPLNILSASAQDTTHPGANLDYKVDLTGCSAPVPAGGSCTLVVIFVGNAVGQRDAVLVVKSNAPGGSNSIGLVAVVAKPKVLANPGVSPPGRVTTISGTGFAPNLPVDIALIGSSEKATATADAKGAFDVPLVLFPRGSVGPRTVTAQTTGKSPTISAEGPFLIALGSVDSPELGIRH